MNTEYVLITKPDDPNLLTYYKSFNAVFTREDEKEPLSGFKDLLSANEEREWAQEFVLIIRDGDVVLGGAQWAAYKTSEGLCIMLSYLHVEEHSRRRGVAKRMLAELTAVTSYRYAKNVDIVMVESEPGDALKAWFLMGFKPAGIEYKAPASQGNHVLDHLTLCYLGQQPSKKQLYRYLSTYIWLSYYRGAVEANSFPKEVQKMLAELKE